VRGFLVWGEAQAKNFAAARMFWHKNPMAIDYALLSCLDERTALPPIQSNPATLSIVALPQLIA
jgi:hypothetical protein